MKVQRLIEKYKKLEGVWNAEGAELARQIFLQDLEQLDKPQPVKVKKFVAEWIEEARKACKDVAELFEFDFTNDEVRKWFMQERPFDLVARAWLDGYEVEKEKQYLVKMPKANFNGNIQILSFKNNSFFWSSNWEGYKAHHTRKELEEAGFGWVFDCEGVEVEEVE
ncbi:MULTISPECIES: DUF1642 domain-containing protein [Streptococcus]|uniref:DUF1642 domain-containing protein n=1 Tax=Streptococcus TaxID=1301 RepID=UPI0006C8CFB7|nr:MULTISPECIES: DUF1642 domain-containing protein [Streptococcus]KPL39550.1 hypothetical protein SPSSI2_09795 [Streptococcus pseudopneumoniae]KPL40945.1 hypothetical protein SPSSI1_06575 [Streptococcus pseudopneumoniae]NIB64150.1 DUF1642 domain-containing protein [Streptococcus pseudopneumoniae]NIB79012.1 DUF1642 domain-containing protein [Streptococcus pseudopneumoniae]